MNESNAVYIITLEWVESVLGAYLHLLSLRGDCAASLLEELDPARQS